MNNHFTFGSPIKADDHIKLPEFLMGTLKGSSNSPGSLENQQTNSNSKARKKFIKMYSQVSPDPHHKKIRLEPVEQDEAMEMARKKNSSKLCWCFEGNKSQQIVDFGFTSRQREVSRDKKPKKMGKIETPVNELIELEEQENSHHIHYLHHPSLSPKK